MIKNKNGKKSRKSKSLEPKFQEIEHDLVLEVRDLRRKYITGDIEVQALDGVNLKVKKGEFIAIVGPSGSGKTTLMNCLGALDFADSGKILYNLNNDGRGYDITLMDNKEQKELRLHKIGLIFQFYNLFPILSAFENVELPILLTKEKTPEQDERIKELFKMVNLDKRMEHKPTQMSGGEQQRVTVARSLSNDPLILLADEPTGELDTETTSYIIKIFVELKKAGHSIVMVTHNKVIAEAADRILTLTDGKIIDERKAGKHMDEIYETADGLGKYNNIAEKEDVKIHKDKDAIIQVTNLKKIYKVSEDVEVHALAGVSINIHKGEFVSVMGPSGSGKTTLLNMIGALDIPTSGKVYINGTNIEKMNDSERTHLRLKQIGFIFQFYNLVPVLTAYENVELPLIFADVPEEERAEKVNRFLDLVGLSDRKDHLPSELSGGEQQRVAVARALSNEPAILIADEPTGELDTKSGMDIINLLRELNKELDQTILMVTHDPSVGALAERTLRMRDGAIVETIINK